MNYRHVYHAGNFADVMKHAILLRLLAMLQSDPAPLTVIDTHAGAGMYDLRGPEAVRTGEAAGGVDRLMAGVAPEVFRSLVTAVNACNAPGETRWYPGSPLLIARVLRNRDRLIACELRPDDHARLKSVLPRQAGAQATKVDGFVTAKAEAARADRPLILIDPPYERADETAKVLSLIAEVRRAKPGAAIALWAPIKDLDGFDALTSGVEDAARGAPVLAAEARLRPLDDPMRLNGSALFVVNYPAPLLGDAREIASWVSTACGESGAVGRAVRL